MVHDIPPRKTGFLSDAGDHRKQFLPRSARAQPLVILRRKITTSPFACKRRFGKRPCLGGSRSCGHRLHLTIAGTEEPATKISKKKTAPTLYRHGETQI